MKIANYVLLGLLSCVEVLAEETTAFDKAVEAYRTYQKARNAYFEAIYAHEETRLAWDTLGSSSRANDEARKKAATVLEKNKEVKGAYAIYQTTAYGYNKALHTIEEVRLADTARKEAKSALDEANRVIDESHRVGRPATETMMSRANKALDAFEEANDIYLTVLDVFEEAIKKAYEKGEKTH